MKRILLLALPLLSAGCLLGPDYERPETGDLLPESFRFVPADTALTNAAPAAVIAEPDWWAAWGDPLLTNLLERGTAANLTLAQAQARLDQSRATLASARAALYPSLGLSGSASRSKTYDPDDTRTSARGSVDAGWEIDLFGRNRRSAEAAAADLEASGLSLEDALLSVRAEIATDYVALRLAQESLEIAHSNLAAEAESTEVARAKGRSGFTAGADVAAADAAIATARAAL
ncbi:MAG: TolC family protein, partial [Kiritimatiellae bacterium]|nr:TolC family protein [Kiritimatiellia bacterium]